MFKTFEYRLYPNRRQREALLKCLVESRRLYNEMLEVVKEHHEETGSFLFKHALTSRFRALGIRTHVCDCCGHIEDRDVNAAKNILKAGMQPSERNAKGCLERAPSSPPL